MWWSWLLSAVGVLGLWLIGNRNRWGFILGIAASALWVAYAVATRQWGFIPTCPVYAAVYWRNLRRWKKAVEHDMADQRSTLRRRVRARQVVRKGLQ